MSTTYQAAYAQYLPLAMQVPDNKVQLCRADVEVALVNLRLGVQAVLGSSEQIQWVKTYLPALPVDDILELPDLGRALVYADGRVVKQRKSDGNIGAALDRVRVLRSQMLHQAEVLAATGKLDKDVVAHIRQGRGKYDMARDGLDLAGLYTEHAAAIAGFHPFTAQNIETLRKDSEWLLERVTPKGARKETQTRTQEADIRDRFWALITERHIYLRKIGYYLHGNDIEQYVPKLQSRVPSKTLAAAKEELKPAAPAPT